MMEVPEKLQADLDKCKTLPSAPGAVVEILELCQDDDIGITEVARILSRDPALSAKALEVANSPLFGVRAQVTTVERAVALLGINATLSFALSFILVRSLRAPQRDSFDHRSFWRRSVVAAVAARCFGSVTATVPPDELFLAGLLQDIGMLALNEAVPGLYRELAVNGRWDHGSVISAEQKALGTDHAAVSAWLLHRWSLPEKLWLAAAGSHEPSVAGEREPAIVRTAALASAVAEIWAHQENKDAAVEAVLLAGRLFGMAPRTFEDKLREIAVVLPEATAKLDIDIGGEERVFQLFDQARETLMNLTLQMQQENQNLEHLSHMDSLTGIANRAFLDQRLPTMFERSAASGQPLSVIFSDLDHFKKINDSYGHGAGDQVLIAVAKWMKTLLRDDDVVARYGGEEFVCLLPNTDARRAAIVAERLRKAIAAQPVTLDDGRCITVLVSLGCVTMSAHQPFNSVQDLLAAADRCLYAAKSAGRNRVVCHEPVESNPARKETAGEN